MACLLRISQCKTYKKGVNATSMLDSNKATLEVFLSDRDDLMQVAFLDADGRIYVRSLFLNQMLKDMLIVLKEKVKRAIEADKQAGNIRYYEVEEESEIEQTIH